jgi:hypothetical protein
MVLVTSVVKVVSSPSVLCANVRVSVTVVKAEAAEAVTMAAVPEGSGVAVPGGPMDCVRLAVGLGIWDGRPSSPC